MSERKLGTEYTCDLCEFKAVTNDGYPEGMNYLTISVARSGFGWGQGVHLCKNCFDMSGYFTDPQSKKKIGKRPLRDILDFIRRKFASKTPEEGG